MDAPPPKGDRGKPGDQADPPGNDPSDAADPTARAAGDPPRQGGGTRRGGRPSRRRRLLIGLLAVAVVIAGVWFLIIPYPWSLRAENPETTSLMRQRIDEARRAGDTLEIRQEWVSLDEISSRLERAVIVAEDYRFREHHGIDWVSLAEEVRWSGDQDFSWLSPADLGALVDAVGYVWSNRHELRGRSTITQQLAKNLYFGTDRSLLRKAMESVVAKRLERRLSKDRILELYLNVAEWGPGIFGVEAASRAYFGRSAGALSLEQAAALAATLPHPLTSNPSRNPGRMAWRRELILDRIDPSRGMPATPIPLPEPRLDFDAGIPRPNLDLPGLEPETVPRDSLADTLRADPLRRDTVPLDTLADDTLTAVGTPPDSPSADTLVSDTARVDSLRLLARPADTIPRDTIGRRLPRPDR